MCCRSSVRPFNQAIAESILRIGRFELNDQGIWRRPIPDEGTFVQAMFMPVSNSLIVNLTPNVSAPSHHLERRVTASVMFEILAKYAEKVDGEVRQEGLIYNCAQFDKEILIASYPDRPLLFDNICPGWRSVFIGAG